MSTTLRCVSPRCHLPAARRCFECDTPNCAAHLTCLQLRLAGAMVSEFFVCGVCLWHYLSDPLIRTIISQPESYDRSVNLSDETEGVAVKAAERHQQ